MANHNHKWQLVDREFNFDYWLLTFNIIDNYQFDSFMKPSGNERIKCLYIENGNF